MISSYIVRGGEEMKVNKIKKDLGSISGHDLSKKIKNNANFGKMRIVGEHGHGHWHSDSVEN